MGTPLFGLDPNDPNLFAKLSKYGMLPPASAAAMAPPADPSVSPDDATMQSDYDLGTGGGAPADASAPAAAPDLSDMPAPLESPDTPPHPNFVSRILAHVLHLPSSADGVFSDKDVDNMRRSALLHASAALAGNNQQGFLPALIGAYSGMNTDFTNQVGAGVKQTMATDQLQDTQRLRQADAVIAAKYPAPVGETAQQKLLRMTQMASDYAAMGQPDRAKALAEAAKNIKAAISPGGEKGFQKVHDTAGNFGIYNPANGQYYFNAQEGWTTTHLDPGVAVANGFRTRRMNQADLLRVQNMNNFERSKYEEVGKDYAADPQVKAMGTMHQNYIMLKTTLHQALNNPAASRVVTGQLAAFADPKARLQMQMMNYLSNVNPSLAGQLSRYASLAATGKLPPGQLKDVSDLVDSIEGASEDNIRTVRRNFIKGKAGVVDTNLLDKYIPSVEETYNTPQQAPVQLNDAVPDEDNQ